MARDDQRSVGELSEQVVRLTRTSHAMRAQVAARGGDGIDWAAYALLLKLVHDGPRRASALAEAACVDPSTVSRQVADLVRAGLVERQPDPEDGRASLLVATTKGHQVHDAKLARRLQIFAKVVEGWSQADVDTLAALLARFNDSFSAVRPALLDELGPALRPVEETSA
jgi:DNA-binding MarR family transcriptional regulator